MIRNSVLTMSACALLLGSSLAHAGASEEQKCLSGRAKAVGKFEACVRNVLAKGYTKGSIEQEAIGKCVDGLDAAWPKLQSLTTSTTCGGLDRIVDNGSTFTDRLTGLVWEKKNNLDGGADNLGNSSDADNGYNNDFMGTENGDLFTTFLDGLDSTLDGSKSWRIPSMLELLTIVKQTIPGDTQTSRYWTSSADPLDSGAAWTVRRDGFGGMLIESVPRWSAQYARGVRTGY